MKKILILMAGFAALILMGEVYLYAAGDLTVDGNLMVGNNIVANNKFQAGAISTAGNANGWLSITYPVAFANATPIVIATGVKSGTASSFYVVTRNIDNQHFEARGFIQDGTALNSTTSKISWLAFVP